MTPPPPPDAMPAIAPSGPALNEAWLRDNLGDDDELLREILDLFIQTTPPIMTALRDAVARQVAADVQTHAHKLKGALLNLAAEAAAAAALKLELDGREGDLSQTPLHLATLEEEVKRALEASAAIAARR